MKLKNYIKPSLLFLFEIRLYFPYTNLKIAEGECKKKQVKQISKYYYSKKKNVSEKRRKERR